MVTRGGAKKTAEKAKKRATKATSKPSRDPKLRLLLTAVVAINVEPTPRGSLTVKSLHGSERTSNSKIV